MGGAKKITLGAVTGGDRAGAIGKVFREEFISKWLDFLFPVGGIKDVEPSAFENRNLIIVWFPIFFPDASFPTPVPLPKTSHI